MLNFSPRVSIRLSSPWIAILRELSPPQFFTHCPPPVPFSLAHAVIVKRSKYGWPEK